MSSLNHSHPHPHPHPMQPSSMYEAGHGTIIHAHQNTQQGNTAQSSRILLTIQPHYHPDFVSGDLSYKAAHAHAHLPSSRYFKMTNKPKQLASASSQPGPGSDANKKKVSPSESAEMAGYKAFLATIAPTTILSPPPLRHTNNTPRNIQSTYLASNHTNPSHPSYPAYQLVQRAIEKANQKNHRKMTLKGPTESAEEKQHDHPLLASTLSTGASSPASVRSPRSNPFLIALDHQPVSPSPPSQGHSPSSLSNSAHRRQQQGYASTKAFFTTPLLAAPSPRNNRLTAPISPAAASTSTSVPTVTSLLSPLPNPHNHTSVILQSHNPNLQPADLIAPFVNHAELAHTKALALKHAAIIETKAPAGATAGQSTKKRASALEEEVANINRYFARFQLDPEEQIAERERERKIAEEKKKAEEDRLIREKAAQEAATAKLLLAEKESNGTHHRTPEKRTSNSIRDSDEYGSSPAHTVRRSVDRSNRVSMQFPPTQTVNSRIGAAKKEEYLAYKKAKEEAAEAAAAEKEREEAERKRKANEELRNRMRLESERNEAKRIAEMEAYRTAQLEQRNREMKLKEAQEKRRTELYVNHLQRTHGVTGGEEGAAASNNPSNAASAVEVMSAVDPLIRFVKKGDMNRLTENLLVKWNTILKEEQAKAKEVERLEREKKEIARMNKDIQIMNDLLHGRKPSEDAAASTNGATAVADNNPSTGVNSMKKLAVVINPTVSTGGPSAVSSATATPTPTADAVSPTVGAAGGATSTGTVTPQPLPLESRPQSATSRRSEAENEADSDSMSDTDSDSDESQMDTIRVSSIQRRRTNHSNLGLQRSHTKMVTGEEYGIAGLTGIGLASLNKKSGATVKHLKIGGGNVNANGNESSNESSRRGTLKSDSLTDQQLASAAAAVSAGSNVTSPGPASANTTPLPSPRVPSKRRTHSRHSNSGSHPAPSGHHHKHHKHALHRAEVAKAYQEAVDIIRRATAQPPPLNQAVASAVDASSPASASSASPTGTASPSAAGTLAPTAASSAIVSPAQGSNISGSNNGAATVASSAPAASAPSSAETESLHRMAAYVDRKDANGSTILFHAIWRKQAHLVPVILSLGANVNAQDFLQNTALHLACLRGIEPIMQELIQRGARIDIANSKNKYAFELPSNIDLKEVVRIASALLRMVRSQLIKLRADGETVGFYTEEEMEPLNQYVNRKTLQLMEYENDKKREGAIEAAKAAERRAQEEEAAAAAALAAANRASMKRSTNAGFPIVSRRASVERNASFNQSNSRRSSLNNITKRDSLDRIPDTLGPAPAVSESASSSNVSDAEGDSPQKHLDSNTIPDEDSQNNPQILPHQGEDVVELFSPNSSVPTAPLTTIYDVSVAPTPMAGATRDMSLFQVPTDRAVTPKTLGEIETRRKRSFLSPKRAATPDDAAMRNKRNFEFEYPRS